MNKKKNYIAPDVEMVEIRSGESILNVSGPEKANLYDNGDDQDW